MSGDASAIAWLRPLLARHDARAIGLWRAGADALVQVAFVPADDLDTAVARRFAAATAVVPLERVDLGIVLAHREGRPVVMTAGAGAGSPSWLREFGATRSIVVPIGPLLIALALGPPPP